MPDLGYTKAGSIETLGREYEREIQRIINHTGTMSEKIPEKVRRNKEIGSQGANTAINSVGTAIEGMMGTDEVGRWTASAMAPGRAATALLGSLLVRGAVEVYSNKVGALKKARDYAAVWNSHGGNGFLAVDSKYAKGLENTNFTVGIYNKNTGAENLVNEAKQLGDNVRTVGITSCEDFGKFESSLINQNVVFCDRSVGTLRLEVNHMLEEDKDAFSTVKNILKEHGVTHIPEIKDGKIAIPKIEAADAESIVQHLYLSRVKDGLKVIDKLANDKELVSEDRVKELKDIVNKGGIPSFSSDELLAIKKGKSYKNFMSLWNGDHDGIPVNKVDIGGGKSWLSINRIKKGGNGCGFVNEVNGIEMPYEISYLMRDENKMTFAMNAAGVNAEIKRAGEMNFIDFHNLAGDPNKGFSTQDLCFSTNGKSMDDFREFMSKNFPNIPWCAIASNQGGQAIVRMSQRSFDSVKMVAFAPSSVGGGGFMDVATSILDTIQNTDTIAF